MEGFADCFRFRHKSNRINMGYICLGGVTELRAWYRKRKVLMLNQKKETWNQKWMAEVESIAELVKGWGYGR